MAIQFTMKQHDTLPKRIIALVQTNPADPTGPLIPVDLTNAGSARLIAKGQAGVGASFTSALTINTPRTAGTVTYTPVVGDTTTPGMYDAEVEVTWTTPAGVETFPDDGYHQIHVVADLG